MHETTLRWWVAGQGTQRIAALLRDDGALPQS